MDKKLLFILLFGILLIPLVNGAWFDFSYFQKSEINFTNYFETLTNFTYLLGNNTLNSTFPFQTDCDDLLVTNSTENAKLPHVFESKTDSNYGCQSNNSIVWVKVDVIPNTNTSSYRQYMYHNNPSATNQELRYSVFNDFSLFYLFGDITSHVVEDMSGHNVNGTVYNTTIANQYTVLNSTKNNTRDFFGYGLYNAPITQSLLIANAPNLTTNFTLGWWVRWFGVNKNVGGYMYNRWQDTNADRQILIQTTTNTIGGTTNLSVFIHGATCGAADVFEFKTNLTLKPDGRYFMAFVHDGINLTGYVNGTMIFTNITGDLCANIHGNAAWGSKSWDNDTAAGAGVNASLDNLFVINRSLSQGYIRAMYEQGVSYFSRLINDTAQLTYIINYTNPVIESQLHNITLNTTYDSSVYIDVNAVLVYNNTDYTMTRTNYVNGSSFVRQVAAPTVSADTTVPFYFRISATSTSNAYALNTTTTNQNVNVFGNLNVTTLVCSDRAYFFHLQDEQNFTELIGDISYNFRFGIGNGSAKQVFGNFTNVNNFSVCINSTASPTWTIGEGEIHYQSSGWVERRFYIFDNTVITNATQNITLYELLNTQQTSFQLQLEDTSLNPLINKYTSTLRWYPQFNEYRIVEMGKTNTVGTTVLHVETEDVDYRIAAYERDGRLIKLDTPTRMICLANPCTYTMRVSPADQDFTSIFGVQYTFTFNSTTKIWLFTFNDLSQQTNRMNLTVYMQSNLNNIPVCSQIVNSFTGVLTCNISQFTTGTFKGIVRREASPIIIITEKIISLTSGAFTSQFGLIMTFIIAVPLVMFLSFVSPIAGIIGIIISLIPALYFNVFGGLGIAIFGAVIIMAFIVVHFLKRSA